MSTIVWIRLEVEGDYHKIFAAVDGALDVGDVQEAIETSAASDDADVSIVATASYGADAVLIEALHDALHVRDERG